MNFSTQGQWRCHRLPPTTKSFTFNVTQEFPDDLDDIKDVAYEVVALPYHEQPDLKYFSCPKVSLFCMRNLFITDLNPSEKNRLIKKELFRHT